jgi:hypothetical protein
MRGTWTASLIAVFGIWVAGAAAQDAGWRPVAAPVAVAQSRPAGSAQEPAATLGRPIATLGRPVLVDPGPSDGGVSAAGYEPPGGPIIRAQAPADGPPAVPPPGVPAVPGPAAVPAIPSGPAGDIYAQPLGPTSPTPPAGDFWGRCAEVFGFGTNNRNFLQSDHAFDNFISPVTNPFQFEDPRSLTELRPIFIFQETPHSNPLFRGTDVEFYGTQARVALTPRLSIVMQQFGLVHISSEPGAPIEDRTGLSEIQIGPKFTFWRGEQTGTLAAVGLTFDIPAGPNRVFQDTGNLTLRPYLSFAQNFGRTSYGSFNFMSTFGYNFGTDNSRSDNFISSWHLDFDVGNCHKIYPLIELNWRHYTANGKVNNFDFEGGDLFNFGSEHIAGKDEVNFGPGVRYKFCEWAQIGTAVEFPIVRRKDLEEFRWTLDFILRY